MHFYKQSQWKKNVNKFAFLFYADFRQQNTGFFFSQFSKINLTKKKLFNKKCETTTKKRSIKQYFTKKKIKETQEKYIFL